MARQLSAHYVIRVETEHMGFIRFVITRRDDETNARVGVFQAAHDLIEAEILPVEHSAELRQLVKWFDKNLPEPDRFSRKHNDRDKDRRGISWFKDTATQPVAQLRRLVAILETAGEQVQMLATQQPGYIVYEDEFQVVAEPFSTTIR